MIGQYMEFDQQVKAGERLWEALTTGDFNPSFAAMWRPSSIGEVLDDNYGIKVSKRDALMLYLTLAPMIADIMQDANERVAERATEVLSEFAKGAPNDDGLDPQIDRISNAMQAIHNILDDGVEEWRKANTYFAREEEIITALNVERAFAERFGEPLEETAENLHAEFLVVKQLVQSVVDCLQILMYKWDEKELSQVPVFVNGLALLKKWLEEGK